MLEAAAVDLHALAVQCPRGATAIWPRCDALTPSERARLRGFTLYRRQLEWLGGRLAAKRALQAAFSERDGHAPPLHAMRIDADERGRPQVPGNGFHLAISHSRRWAVAVAGDEPVGVDVEHHDALRAQSAGELLRPAEIEVLRRRLFCDPLHARTALWCLKEAWFKALGPRQGFALFAKAWHLQDWGMQGRLNWRMDTPQGAASPEAGATGRAEVTLHGQYALVQVQLDTPPATSRFPRLAREKQLPVGLPGFRAPIF